MASINTDMIDMDENSVEEDIGVHENAAENGDDFMKFDDIYSAES